MAAVVFSAMASSLNASDHPGPMTTAAIAFVEIERTRPELVEKMGLLFLAQTDAAPFGVAAGEAGAMRPPGASSSNVRAGRTIAILRHLID